MSENKPANKNLIKTVIAVVIVLIVLPVIYLAGNFILPSSIKSSYLDKNCDRVLSLTIFYTSVYPSFMTDQSVDDLTSECALYSLAVEKEEKKAWQDAYNTYKTYVQTYPKGQFIVEAQEHSAIVLTAWAKDQLAAKEYGDALGTLDLILQNFGETDAASEAADLMAEVYTAWAKDQRDESDFAGAEETLKAFKAWAESAEKPDDAQAAQRELAQTYLAWGLAFQAQKQFEDAKARLDLAIATDPEPLAAEGPAIQAKAAQAALYTEWGDALLEKNDFTAAIDRYQKAISFTENKDQPTLKDKVAAVYLKWAANLNSSEDFLGALKKIDEAAKNTATDTGKKSIESAKTETYNAFSSSAGTQARQIIKDTIQGVCDKNKAPGLPIFGVDKKRILSATYGIDEKLLDNVAATTPGNMHYVACIEMTTETLQKTTFLWATFVREKYTWNVTLRQVITGEVVSTTGIAGGEPPPLPQLTRGNFLDYLFGGSFYRSRGTNPDVVDLSNWLLATMKQLNK